MNIMTPPARTAQPDLGAIASATSETCIATRVRQLSRIVTRVYDDALRPHKITASQFTLLTQLAQTDGITAAEIGLDLDIEKSTLSRNLKRLLALGHIEMDPPAGRRGRRASAGRLPARRRAGFDPVPREGGPKPGNPRPPRVGNLHPRLPRSGRLGRPAEGFAPVPNGGRRGASATDRQPADQQADLRDGQATA